MQKLVKIVFSLTLLCIMLTVVAHAQENDELNDMLENQYEQYDLSDIDTFMKEETGTTYSEIITSILNGTFNIQETVGNNLVAIIMPSFKKAIQGMPILILLILITGIISNLLPEGSSFYKQLSNIASASICVCLFISFISVFNGAKEAINSISEGMNQAIPLLSVALVASGATSTANTLSPESAIISQGGANIINNIVLPLILVMAIILILDVVFVQNRFSNVFNFGKSLITWGAGGLFTIYAAMVSINGFASASYDGISLRAVRYAMSNTIPLIGSLLGDGVNMAIACCSIVKSAMGIATFIMIILVSVAPIASMTIYLLILRAVSACISPFASSEVLRLISSTADLIKIMVSVLMGLLIIILIMLGFVIAAANSF